jgi:acetoin utilization deacetylase AcuC-like enzyme
MRRYSLLHQIARRLAGLQWVEPKPVDLQPLLRVHTPAYLEKALQGGLSRLEERNLGLPWSPALVERSLLSVGASCEAALALHFRGGSWDVAANLAGGTHHAYADRGEGFCLLNDCVVAARHAQVERGLKQVAFIDLDVHQGNGTAHLCAQDASLFTLSLHAQNNYPWRKEVSDCDLGLPDGCDDDTYLEVLDRGLSRVWQVQPQLVFYLAGADPYCKDRLGRLGLSQRGLARRDLRVLAGCRQRNIPVVIVMAGGYAEPIEHTATIQARTLAIAQFLLAGGSVEEENWLGDEDPAALLDDCDGGTDGRTHSASGHQEYP